jgi:hypothetical protein
MYSAPQPPATTCRPQAPPPTGIANPRQHPSRQRADKGPARGGGAYHAPARPSAWLTKGCGEVISKLRITQAPREAHLPWPSRGSALLWIKADATNPATAVCSFLDQLN